jgi:hypothetical protein
MGEKVLNPVLIGKLEGKAETEPIREYVNFALGR